MTPGERHVVRCKHNMIAAACAFCAPPRATNVPQHRREAAVHATSAVSRDVVETYGIAVVHTSGPRDRAVSAIRDMDKDTLVVHICGTPFLWAFEELLQRLPNLKTIQVIPTMLAKCRARPHDICRARGVEVKAGHIRPDLVWEDDRIVSRHYDAQRRFMSTLSGPQKALFDELMALGFDAAMMAQRYYRLDGGDGVTQAAIAVEFGLSAADNSRVSGCVLAVLYYLDGTMQVGETSKRRASNMRRTVERLRPYIVSIESRAKLLSELGLQVLAEDFPMARAETLRALLAAVRDGRFAAMQDRDARGAEATTLRFGLNELERGVYRRLADVGQLMGGISRERARQLEERALKSLGIEEDW